jgi:hypothetical protein
MSPTTAPRLVTDSHAADVQDRWSLASHTDKGPTVLGLSSIESPPFPNRLAQSTGGLA